MPIDYTLYMDPPLLVTTGSGVVTDEDLFDYTKKALADPRIPVGVPEFIDFGSIEDFGASAVGLTRLASINGAHAEDIGPSKQAVLVSSVLAFGLVRMFELLCDEHPNSIHVFRDRSEAESWLGLKIPST